MRHEIDSIQQQTKYRINDTFAAIVKVINESLSQILNITITKAEYLEDFVSGEHNNIKRFIELNNNTEQESKQHIISSNFYRSLKNINERQLTSSISNEELD